MNYESVEMVDDEPCDGINCPMCNELRLSIAVARLTKDPADMYRVKVVSKRANIPSIHSLLKAIKEVDDKTTPDSGEKGEKL